VWRKKDFEEFYRIMEWRETKPEYLPVNGGSEPEEGFRQILKATVITGGNHGAIEGDPVKRIRAGVCRDAGGSAGERKRIANPEPSYH
jgi:hypothetical protein